MQDQAWKNKVITFSTLSISHTPYFIYENVCDFGILEYELSFSFEIQFGLYNPKT